MLDPTEILYRVPMGFTLDDLTLMLKTRSQSFDSKYLEDGDRYEVGPQRGLFKSSHGFLIGTVRFDLG